MHGSGNQCFTFYSSLIYVLKLIVNPFNVIIQNGNLFSQVQWKYYNFWECNLFVIVIF